VEPGITSRIRRCENTLYVVAASSALARLAIATRLTHASTPLITPVASIAYQPTPSPRFRMQRG